MKRSGGSWKSEGWGCFVLADRRQKSAASVSQSKPFIWVGRLEKILSRIRVKRSYTDSVLCCSELIFLKSVLFYTLQLLEFACIVVFKFTLQSVNYRVFAYRVVYKQQWESHVEKTSAQENTISGAEHSRSTTIGSLVVS